MPGNRNRKLIKYSSNFHSRVRLLQNRARKQFHQKLELLTKPPGTTASSGELVHLATVYVQHGSCRAAAPPALDVLAFTYKVPQ